MPDAKPLSQSTTSNLWRHIGLKHPTVLTESSKTTRRLEDKNDACPQSHASLTAFFQPNLRGAQPTPSTKFRELLLLEFIVLGKGSSRPSGEGCAMTIDYSREPDDVIAEFASAVLVWLNDRS